MNSFDPFWLEFIKKGFVQFHEPISYDFLLWMIDFFFKIVLVGWEVCWLYHINTTFHLIFGRWSYMGDIIYYMVIMNRRPKVYFDIRIEIFVRSFGKRTSSRHFLNWSSRRNIMGLTKWFELNDKPTIFFLFNIEISCLEMFWGIWEVWMINSSKMVISFHLSFFRTKYVGLFA